MSETYKKRITDFLSSILMPRTVRTNNCDGLIHLLACLTMLIDHSGKVLFGNMAQMRIIGRLAFPLFAYSLAAGVVFTHDSRKYLTRIVLLALISQPFYALGLLHTTPAMFAVPFLKNPLGAALTFYLASWQTPSILLSLSLALCILIALRDRNYILAIGVYVLCERFGSAFDNPFAAQADVASGAKAAITGMDWLGLILICFVLPAVLAPLINMGCRKLGWVKDGDLTI